MGLIFERYFNLDCGLFWCNPRPIFTNMVTEWNIFKKKSATFFKEILLSKEKKISLIIAYENSFDFEARTQ